MRRGITMSTAAGAAAVAMASMVGLPAPAGAKGVESVVLDGPGLAEPVVLSTDDKGVGLLDDAGHPVKLVDELNPWAVMDQTTPGLAPEAPTKDLGPPYSVTWRMYGATTPVEQDLYPFAAGGPLVHIPAEPIWDYDTRDRWYRVPDTLLGTLADVGVIAPDGSGPKVPEAVVPAKAPSTAPVEAGDSLWPEVVAGLGTAVAAVGTAFVVRSRRARRRERVAPVPL
jgi:hypothetical protein